MTRKWKYHCTQYRNDSRYKDYDFIIETESPEEMIALILYRFTNLSWYRSTDEVKT